MALLIDVGHSGWMTADDIRTQLRHIAPQADIRTCDDLGDPAEIRMLAVSALRGDLLARLPNLELVQKLGAGVETILRNPDLGPHMRVTRLKPDAPAREIAEYILAYILRAQRNMAFHEAEQRQSRWTSAEPRETPQTTVGVLGLGHIGGRTARLLRDLGYQVHGWSRAPKAIDGVTCCHGPEALPALLGRCDHVAAILPATDETRGLFGPNLLSAMKPGSQLINCGRGDLIDETALVQALDAGTPGHAVLDVLSQEPLPPASPLWSHPQVTLTPHVSGWHLGDALADVAENWHRLQNGAPLLHEVDRAAGY